MLLLKFVLAFCGLSYELVLAQGLSAFLNNTVLRYSTTIGLYMFAMGLGAWASGRTANGRCVRVLWQSEIMLIFLGGCGLTSLFCVSGADWPAAVIIILAYLWVGLIGFFTGLELPLMLRIAVDTNGPSRAKIIAMDYAGAFMATLFFVFYFYPSAGLIHSAMILMVINALAGLVVAWKWQSAFDKSAKAALLVSWLILGGASVLLLFSTELQAQLITLYIGQAVNGY
jgi:spermidine synthase